MTVKEIAQAVGKDERSVQRWVKTVADKMSSINDKMSSSTSTYPADYNLFESCAIIEEGMGVDVANVFRTNAVQAKVEAKVETKKQAKLPTATQMNALERLYGQEGARDRIDFAMGYTPPKEQIALPLPRLSKQAYAVQMQVEQKQKAKAEMEKKTPKLF